MIKNNSCKRLICLVLSFLILLTSFVMLFTSNFASAEESGSYMLQMQNKEWQYVYQQIMENFEPGANYRFSADAYVYAGKATFLLDVHKPNQDNAVRARFDPKVGDVDHHYSADFTAPDTVCTTGERAKITIITRNDHTDGRISDFIAGNISIYKLDGSGNPTGDNMVKDSKMATGLSSNTWSSSINPWYSNGSTTTATCRFVPQPDGIFDSDSIGKQMVTLQDVSWGYVRQHITNNFTANAKYRFTADAKALVGTTTIILKVCNGSGDYETSVRFDPKPDDVNHHYSVDFTAPSSVMTSGERGIIEIFTREQVDGKNPSVSFANIAIYKLSGNNITGDNLVNDYQMFSDFGTIGWSTGANPWYSSLIKGTEYVKAPLTDGFFDAEESAVPKMAKLSGNGKMQQDVLDVEPGSYRFSFNMLSENPGIPKNCVGYENEDGWTQLAEGDLLDLKVSGNNYQADFSSNKKFSFTFLMENDDPAARVYYGSPTLYKLDGTGVVISENLILDSGFSTGCVDADSSTDEHPWYSKTSGSNPSTSASFEFPDINGFFAPKNMLVMNSKEWQYIRNQIVDKFEAGAKYRFSADAFAFFGNPTILLRVVDGSGNYDSQRIGIDPKANDANHHYSVDFIAPDTVASSGETAIIDIFTREAQNGVNNYFAVGNISLYKLDENGNPTGNNMVRDSAMYTELNANSWSTATNPWFGVGTGDINKTYRIIQQPDGYFDNDSIGRRMVKLTGTWRYFQTETGNKLTPGHMYKFVASAKFVSNDSSDIPNINLFIYDNTSNGKSGGYINQRIKIEPGEGNNYEYSFLAPDDVATSGVTMQMVAFTRGSDGTLYLANIALFEVDDNGNRIGDNLFNTDEAMLTDISANTWSSSANPWYTNGNADEESHVMMLQPADFFPGFVEIVETDPKNIYISDSNGIFSQITTVKPNTDYVLIYDCKYESESQAKPYVAAFTGSERTEIKISDLRLGTYKNFYREGYYFKTPASLCTSNNLRVGIKFDNSVSGYFSNFELYEVNDLDEEQGENLLSNSDLARKALIVNYAPDIYGKWTKEGTYGTAKISKTADKFFDILSKKMLVFEGASYATGDGRWGFIEQDAKLTPGKKYMLSMDYRQANSGAGDTFGPKLIWVDSDGEDNSFGDLQMTESETEYHRTYTFTQGAKARTGNDNFRLRIWASTAFISGYVANVELYELDSSGKPTGENLIKNGSFDTGDMSYWEKTNLFNIFEIVERSDTIFKKGVSGSNHVIDYRNPTSWSSITQYVSLKDNTEYILKNQAIHTSNDPEFPSRVAIQAFSGESSFFITPDKTTTDKNNVETFRFKTPKGLRLSGDNVKIFLYMISTGNAGFWGASELYELDKNGKPIGENLLLNYDFSCEMAAWEVSGEVSIRNEKIADTSIFKNGIVKDKMVTSTGSASKAMFSQTKELEVEEKYVFSGFLVNMNAGGVTPKIYYTKKNGKSTELEAEVFYDPDRFYFEVVFTVPKNALSENGKTSVTVGMENPENGKGYFSNLMLTKYGEYINIFTNPELSNSAAGWNKNANYQVVKFDPEVFVFYFDDEKFDDGNWSGDSENGVLFSYGMVSGNVVDESGKGISNVKLTLKPLGISIFTDKYGDFVFPRVSLGEYELYITFERELFCCNVTVSAGMNTVISNISYGSEDDSIDFDDITDVEFEDDSVQSNEYGVIVGKYVTSDGDAMKNAKLCLGNDIFAMTNSKGEFTFEKVPAGEYKVYEITSGGKKIYLSKATVIAGKGLRLTLKKPGSAQSNSLLIWLIIGSAALLIIAGGVTVLIIIKKKAARVRNI